MAERNNTRHIQIKGCDDPTVRMRQQLPAQPEYFKSFDNVPGRKGEQQPPHLRSSGVIVAHDRFTGERGYIVRKPQPLYNFAPEATRKRLTIDIV